MITLFLYAAALFPVYASDFKDTETDLREASEDLNSVGLFDSFIYKYGQDIFRPDANVTRSDLILILQEYNSLTCNFSARDSEILQKLEDLDKSIKYTITSAKYIDTIVQEFQKLLEPMLRNSPTLTNIRLENSNRLEKEIDTLSARIEDLQASIASEPDESATPYMPDSSSRFDTTTQKTGDISLSEFNNIKDTLYRQEKKISYMSSDLKELKRNFKSADFDGTSGQQSFGSKKSGTQELDMIVIQEEIKALKTAIAGKSGQSVSTPIQGESNTQILNKEISLINSTIETMKTDIDTRIMELSNTTDSNIKHNSAELSSLFDSLSVIQHRMDNIAQSLTHQQESIDRLVLNDKFYRANAEDISSLKMKMELISKKINNGADDKITGFDKGLSLLDKRIIAMEKKADSDVPDKPSKSDQKKLKEIEKRLDKAESGSKDIDDTLKELVKRMDDIPSKLAELAETEDKDEKKDKKPITEAAASVKLEDMKEFTELKKKVSDLAEKIDTDTKKDSSGTSDKPSKSDQKKLKEIEKRLDRAESGSKDIDDTLKELVKRMDDISSKLEKLAETEQKQAEETSKRIETILEETKKIETLGKELEKIEKDTVSRELYSEQKSFSDKLSAGIDEINSGLDKLNDSHETSKASIEVIRKDLDDMRKATANDRQSLEKLTQTLEILETRLLSLSDNVSKRGKDTGSELNNIIKKTGELEKTISQLKKDLSKTKSD
ncbi:MAG: hypothetical protein ABIH89_09320 [Elusimicrobiota bacterium]